MHVANVNGTYDDDLKEGHQVRDERAMISDEERENQT